MTHNGRNLIGAALEDEVDFRQQGDETSLSFLERLRSPTDTQSWQRFVDLYTPLIRSWLEEYAQHPDMDDVVQEILTELVSRLPAFHRQPRPGAFRCWLRTITMHRLCSYLRSERGRPLATGDTAFLNKLKRLEDPDGSLSQLWDRQHDEHVLRWLLEQVKPHFQRRTWQAFQLVVLRGQSPKEVAEKLNISINAVIIAKSRVLQRLRQEGAGLIDTISIFS